MSDNEEMEEGEKPEAPVKIVKKSTKRPAEAGPSNSEGRKRPNMDTDQEQLGVLAGLLTDTVKGLTPAAFYRCIRSLTRKVFEASDMSNDHNAETCVSQIINVLGDEKAQIPEKLTFYLEKQLKEVKVNKDTQGELVSLRDAVTQMDRKFLNPHLCLYQNSLKTREEVLYTKNTCTKALGLPPYLEIFAHGKLVKDKLKRSRPRAIGVLNHVQNLARLFGHIQPRQQTNAKTLSKLDQMTIANSKKKILNTIVVGRTQKMMVSEFLEGNFHNLYTFGLTLPFIKPRTEHAFMIHPCVLMKMDVDTLEKASYVNNWAWETMKAHPFDMVHPKSFEESGQIITHMFLQTQHEDLEVLNWVFKHPMTPRQSWKPWNNREEMKTTPFTFDYNYWAKAQKGAPISTGQISQSQINSIPSLRGARKVHHSKVDIGALINITGDKKGTFLESVVNEIDEYRKILHEGTGDFYAAGDSEGTTPIRCDVGGNGKYFLGDQTKNVG